MLTLSASGAFMRGTITKGINPLDGSALDGEPADNITPVKILAAVRFTEPRGRWWAEYGDRTQTDVTRVTPTLLTSPFRIAQDLLSLDGFTVQRIGWGVALTRGRDRLEPDLRGREPDQPVLPRALPVRAGARSELHRRRKRRHQIERVESHFPRGMLQWKMTPNPLHCAEEASLCGEPF